MIDKMKTDKFLLEQPLLSRRQYSNTKIRVVVALLIVVLTLVLTFYFWISIAWYVKLLLSFFVFGLSPDIDDLKSIRVPYDVYKDEWEKHNEKKNNS